MSDRVVATRRIIIDRPRPRDGSGAGQRGEEAAARRRRSQAAPVDLLSRRRASSRDGSAEHEHLIDVFITQSDKVDILLGDAGLARKKSACYRSVVRTRAIKRIY